MHIHYISIFPEIFTSFLSTSLIHKAQEKSLLAFSVWNPREYCKDKHRQVDDEIYGGGQGMLMKAPPVLDTIKDVLAKNGLTEKNKNRKLVMLGPSEDVFSQYHAHQSAKDYEHIIFLCGRYEGFDHRIQLWCQKHYPEQFVCWSLGQFVTLGGEAPSMVITEAIVRLLPGVIKEQASREDESYSIRHQMNNLEYPQYTRPDTVAGMKVPEILLSGHHKNITQWKQEQQRNIDKSSDS